MSEHIFKLPDLGEGTVESEIGEWFIKVGDVVEEEAVVCTMMTDKAAVELASPVSGTVTKLAGEPGDVVAVGAALVVFETDGAVAKDASTEIAAAEDKPVVATSEPTPAKKPATPVTDDPNGRVITSPAIRRRAKEAGIDLHEVPGTGPGGRIQRKDFDNYLKARASGISLAAARGPSTAIREIKVIGLRRIIAERMSRSKQEIPHFAYVEEIDITELEALRRHLNSRKASSSERLTLLPFLGLALIRALKEYPQCNATYNKDRNLILQYDAVHLGVATQTPDGLKVPVVKHAEMLDIDGLANEIRRVTQAARDNSAKKNELSGSTITITSLGRLGGIASTPVINMPEVGIIGVNRAAERPMAYNGQIAVRLMMNLSSSFDHRFVDGYDAAAMIQRIKEMLEHPATIFLPD
ncbi:MAG TPA: dihydrolipoamide acetyltransferase family protein [Woeseiaceae bacterium]|nr:dihydrolipoamide acetyltransferase family protein [Woeseiaceae bacterium]